MKTCDHRLELTNWKFQIDEKDMGESCGWHLPDYDHSKWLDVTAPGAWDFYDIALRHYQGVGWYYAEIPAPAGSGMEHTLEFTGVGGRAWVWINGKLAGFNAIRYLPFQVNISKLLNNSGINTITIKVDNSFQGNRHLTGGDRVEWVLYGGLIQKVYLAAKPLCRIEHIDSKTGSSGNADVVVTVINNGNSDFSGAIKLILDTDQAIEAKASVRCGAGRKCEIKLELRAQSFEPWSPGNPVLYDLTAILSDDASELHRASLRIGFRTVECKDARILLNGEPILIKGVNRYDEYHPYGTSVPEHIIRKELENIKQCGVNLIRVHYPQAPIHLEIADEIGLMYMLEVPINWWYPRDEEKPGDYSELESEAIETLNRTYDVFGNHSCWVVWSMSNESVYRNETGIGLVRMLAERAKKMDCRRLITNVVNYLPEGRELEFCDFMCLNRYHGIFQPINNLSELEQYITEPTQKDLAWITDRYPDKPIVMSEFGAMSIKGILGTGQMSEERHGESIKYTYKAIMTNKNACGAILWSWADYFHNRHVYQTDEGAQYMKSDMGLYGVVTVDRRIKDRAYKALVEIFTDAK